MAYKKIKNNNYVADSAADLKKMRERDMNASCYIIDEACEYRLKSTGEWVKQATTTVSNSEGNNIDLSNYATKSFVEEAIATIEHPVVDLSDYAKIADLDSAVSGLKADMVSHTDLEASGDQSVAIANTYTDTKIAEVEGKIPDISNFATKNEIPSLDGYAMEVEVEALKANPVFKLFSADNVQNSAHEQYGIYIKASDNKTLVEAMKEKGLGMYNFFIEKGSPDMPDVLNANNESGHGICVVDYYNSPDNWIGYIMIFSKGNHMCFRYITHGTANDWVELA